ncbi:MAG: hydrogenase maturation protease [Elusimicrobiota bacterium]|jgi:hydrogenase maturation protease
MKKTTILLALGNDIMGDDGVGLVAAEQLERLAGPDVEVLCTAESGFRVMEFLEGYDNALLIDSVTTGANEPGTILELSKDAFLEQAKAPSPHYAGVPEVFDMAERLDLHFPKNFRVLAVEIEPQKDFKTGLSPKIQAAVPELVRRSQEILRSFAVQSSANGS